MKMRKTSINFVILVLLGCLFISLIASSPLAKAQEGQVTLNPTDDTYTDFDNPDSNYGGQSSLIVSKFKDSFDNVWETIVWLRFNLSSVPDGAVVDVATLQLDSCIVTETYNVYAHSCSNNSWTELTLTYSNMPAFNTTSMDSEVVSSSSQYYNWSVVDAVRNAIDGIYGGPDVVTIVLQETSFRGLLSQASFYSKENFEVYVPKLTIHWTHIIPEFPSFLILPIFMIATLLAVIVYRRKYH
jgi:hypothetical protein